MHQLQMSFPFCRHQSCNKCWEASLLWQPGMLPTQGVIACGVVNQAAAAPRTEAAPLRVANPIRGVQANADMGLDDDDEQPSPSAMPPPAPRGRKSATPAGSKAGAPSHSCLFPFRLKGREHPQSACVVKKMRCPFMHTSCYRQYGLPLHIVWMDTVCIVALAGSHAPGGARGRRQATLGESFARGTPSQVSQLH